MNFYHRCDLDSRKLLNQEATHPIRKLLSQLLAPELSPVTFDQRVVCDIRKLSLKFMALKPCFLCQDPYQKYKYPCPTLLTFLFTIKMSQVFMWLVIEITSNKLQRSPSCFFFFFSIYSFHLQDDVEVDVWQAFIVCTIDLQERDFSIHPLIMLFKLPSGLHHVCGE